MRIALSKLKQIIKEETTKLFKEWQPLGVDPTPIDPETGLDFKIVVGLQCSGGDPLPPPKCRLDSTTMVPSQKGPHGYDHCPPGYKKIPVGCPKGQTVQMVYQLPKYVKKVKGPGNKWLFHNERTGRFLKIPKRYGG